MRLASFVENTSWEFPLRRVYNRLRGLPPISDWEYRDLRESSIRRLAPARSIDCKLRGNRHRAHEEMFLREFIRFAPQGRHVAFEPIPALAAGLRKNFPAVEVHDCALSDHTATATFQYVPSLPGWSGLRAQPYPGNVAPTPITVSVRRLDDVLDPTVPIAFIKIDVEGAELEVLRGATATLTRCRPLVYFECGKVHHAFYETAPENV